MKTRCKQIPFRVTEKELEIINSKAKKCGLSREAYLRKTALEAQVKELPDISHLDVVFQLKMIGNNIRQIAIKANTLGFVDKPLYYKNYEELQAVIGKIMEALY